MESIFQHGNWKKEKGLTLTETVIALTITTIVSVAVVSISIYAANALYKERARDFFIHESNNIASIYQEYDETNYPVAIKHLTGLDVNAYEDVTIYYHDDFSYANSDSYSYYMNVKYTEDKLELSSYNAKDAEIFKRSIAR